MLEREKALLPFTLKVTEALPVLRTHLFHPPLVARVFRLLTTDESKMVAVVGVSVELEGDPSPYKLEIPTSLVK